MPDFAIIIDDQAGLIRIMMDDSGLLAHECQHGAADSRPLSALTRGASYV
jgi:hypothetical protein